MRASLSFPSLKYSGTPLQRMGIAFALVFLLHLIFFLVLAPHLLLNTESKRSIEVTQLSAKDFKTMKEKILQNQRQMAPLLQQELREEFKSKEVPKDAQMMGAFNQVVPKQTIAGAQSEAPQVGGGQQGNADQTQKAQQENNPKAEQKKISLQDLGVHKKLPSPTVYSQNQPERSRALRESVARGERGPERPHVPVGRDAKDLEKGRDNLLNAVESEYYSFFVRFEEPIVKNWYFLIRSNESRLRSEIENKKMPSGAEAYVTVEFSIDESGEFRYVKIIKPSGLPTLDWTVTEAIQKLRSLPNPPKGLFKDSPYFTHQLTFTLVVSDSPYNQAKPGLYW